METHRGIGGSWTPETPVKPNVARPSPIYDNGQGGVLAQQWVDREREEYLSKFTSTSMPQNNESQSVFTHSINSTQRSSYPSTSNNIWDNSQGNTFFIGNDEILRRNLEGNIPHWSSQGRRSVMSYGSGNLESVCYPSYNSWGESELQWSNNGIRETGSALEHHFSDAELSSMPFSDLLSINESLTLRNNCGAISNGMFLPNWGFQQEAGGLNNNQFQNHQEGLCGINQQCSQVMRNDARTGPFCNINDLNALPSYNQANGNSTFAPATPDLWRRVQNNSTPLDINQGLNDQKALQEHVTDLNIKNGSDQITDSPPDKASMAVEEDHNPNKELTEGNDVNSTPQQKPKRRRKYTPKVIRENKPKRTPRPNIPKPPETPSEASVKEAPVKRKYARKKKASTPKIPPEEEKTPSGEASEPTEPKIPQGVATEPEIPSGEATEPKSSAKSCKKSLNFDLNGGLDEPTENGSQETDNQSSHTVGLTQAEEFMAKTSMTAYDLNLTQTQQLKEYLLLPEQENLDRPQTDINISLGEETGNCVRKQSSSPCASSSEGWQSRGSKRKISFADKQGLLDVEIMTLSQHISWQSKQTCPITEKSNPTYVPEISKRNRTEQIQTSQLHASSSIVVQSEELSQIELTISKSYSNSTPTGISEGKNNHAMSAERMENKSQLMNTWTNLSRLKQQMSKTGPTHVLEVTQLTGIASASEDAHSKKDGVRSSHSCHVTLNTIHPSAKALPTDKNASSKSKRTSKKEDSVNMNWNIVPYKSISPAIGAKGRVGAKPGKRRVCSIERLTELFQLLDIYRQKRRTCRRKQSTSIVPYRGKKQEQNELVLYQNDGSMVPFEGPFNPIKKRRARAKVDLDDETTQVWKLLLENIDNEGVNGTDEQKAKWWENERSVFRGRVDSFIARMRLVQGDRRFTPWKGSVLDSVIGVFLTQNVSDHLSSNAFMSMAARFPLKPETSGSALSEEATSSLFGEPEICVIDEPEQSITWNEKTINEPTQNKNSRAVFYFEHSEEKEVASSSETCQKDSSRGYNANSQDTQTENLVGEYKARDDASSSQHSVISSQNSIDSSNLHTATFMGLLKMAEGNFYHQSNSHTLVQNHFEGIKQVSEYYQETAGVSSSNYQVSLETGFLLRDTQGIDILEVESRTSNMSRKDENSPTTEQSNLTSELTDQERSPDSFPRAAQNVSSYFVLEGETMVVLEPQMLNEPLDTFPSPTCAQTSTACKDTNVIDVIESTREVETTSVNNNQTHEQKSYASGVAHEHKQGVAHEHKQAAGGVHEHNYASGIASENTNTTLGRIEKGRPIKWKKSKFDWDSLRREAEVNGMKERPAHFRDSLDWEAVLQADASVIADTIKERGMNNVLAGRIKDLLDRLVKDHGRIDMEWLRDIPPDKAKEYLLSFRGLGLKSVECVSLLTLHHMAFPVDTNVGRIAVRLGWVPLQPLPESLQLHLLEMYPILESIQQYLWPRLCKLDQKTLYELHYHMITFGKVFCTKQQPNCNACPLRGECRHFASAFASARLALPGPEEKSIVLANGNTSTHVDPRTSTNLLPSIGSWENHNPQSNSERYGSAMVREPSLLLSLSSPQPVHLERKSINSKCEPIVEVPASPEQEPQNEQALCDIEDTFYEDPNEIPTINLNLKEFADTLQNFMVQGTEMSSALVALTAEAASIPTPKLKNINRLRTEHHVYELPDTHPLLRGLEKREPDDPCSYLLAIWTPGETAESIDPPARRCCFDNPNMLCNEETCSYCSSQREAENQIVRGTLLIPTRTAMRGSFPLNGTYFQVNEVFADHDSSLNPIAVPRSWLWNLARRTVYFGTSIPTIFKGLTTEEIQHCFWRGYVCVRGFDQKTRGPRPLMARLHFPASRLKGAKGKYDE